MAINLQCRRIAKLGFPFLSSSLAPFIVSARRGVHVSVYDKNEDEHVRPSIVPDEVIQSRSGGGYWIPHPQTGVFGPPVMNQTHSVGAPVGSGQSVLEQKAFFRSLEDLEKPPHSGF